MSAVAVIRVGRLIDGVSDEPVLAHDVVIEGANIVEIRPTGAAPVADEDVILIDAPKSTLMPGMIDLHMHVFKWKQPHDRPGPDEPILEVGLRGLNNASELLDLGVTTARDVGARDNLSIQLRDLIAGGRVRGPRFFAAGTQLEMRGRGDFFYRSITVSGAVEAQAAARRQLRAGADWIKVMATAGTGGGAGNLMGEPGWQQLTEEELRAATEQAHMAGRKITTHAIGRDGIKAALRAGVDCIEHGTYLDDEAIEMMLEGDVSLVPTLMIGRNLGEHGRERGFGQNVVENAKRGLPVAMESAYKAHEAGVRIGVGSDVDLDETAAQEIRMLIEAGLKPMDAIRAATSNAACVIGMQDRIGTIEPGKIADLIVLDGDPLDDPFALDRVTHVVQGGNLQKSPASVPADIRDGGA